MLAVFVLQDQGLQIMVAKNNDAIEDRFRVSRENTSPNTLRTYVAWNVRLPLALYVFTVCISKSASG